MSFNRLQMFFGFDRWPFSISPDPGLVFWSQHHRQAINTLRDGIEQRMAIMLFTGEVGTGKTTVIRHLISNADSDIVFAQVLNPLISTDELLREICTQFGCLTAELSPFNSLVSFLHELNERGERPVLVIDEAQHLNFEALEQLRLITNIETDTHKLITLILIGQPELREVVQQPRLRQFVQRIGSRPHLKNLTKSETKNYINVRLQLAGRNDAQKIFSGRLISSIYDVTSGTPRKINALCSKALAVAFGESSSRVTLKHIKIAIPQSLDWSSRSPRKIGLKPTLLALLLLTVAVVAFQIEWQSYIGTFKSTSLQEGSLTEIEGPRPLVDKTTASDSLVWDRFQPLTTAPTEVRNAVGPIDYAAHVYVEETDRGFAFVNGERKVVGSFIGRGQIQLLNRDGIIVMVAGERYSLAALQSIP